MRLAVSWLRLSLGYTSHVWANHRQFKKKHATLQNSQHNTMVSGVTQKKKGRTQLKLSSASIRWHLLYNEPNKRTIFTNTNVFTTSSQEALNALLSPETLLLCCEPSSACLNKLMSSEFICGSAGVLGCRALRATEREKIKRGDPEAKPIP